MFLFGTGGNGKTVFMSTVTGIFGDYAITAPMEMFLTSNVDRHPTEIAKLKGARLVVAHETQKGRRWDESKIKTLTGGDPISGRFMRGDFFWTSGRRINLYDRRQPQADLTQRSTKRSAAASCSYPSPSAYRRKIAPPSLPRSSKRSGQLSCAGCSDGLHRMAARRPQGP